MTKCKDCGHEWRTHVPVGLCVQSGGGYDQCGCDSIPDGTWVTVDSLAAAVFAADDPHFRFATRGNCERFAAAIIKAAKEKEAERENE